MVMISFRVLVLPPVFREKGDEVPKLDGEGHSFSLLCGVTSPEP